MTDSSIANDRLLIMDAVAKYAWGYDEGDFSSLGDAFTEEATTTLTISGSDVGYGPIVGRSNIIEALRTVRNGQSDQRRHTLHNHRFIQQSDGKAKISLYMSCLASKGGSTRLVTTGKYSASLAKGSDSVWRMTDLMVELDSPF